MDDFVDLMEFYLKSRIVRSTASAGEDVLQGVVELLLDEPNSRVPELRLMDVENSKPCSRFVDIFIPPMVEAGMAGRTRGIALELKNFNLRGLLCGEKGIWNDAPPYSDLDKLGTKLDNEDEQILLARKYLYWSRELKKPVLTTVGAISNDAKVQLDNYMHLIAHGESKSYGDLGVRDHRIRVGEGRDDLQGHVIMNIGGRRILLCSTKLMPTQHEYMRALRF